MGSTWGKRKNLPGYDSFRTGLTFEDVRQMLRTSEKHRDRHLAPHDRRHTVLGYWHELKVQLYDQAVERGFSPPREESRRRRRRRRRTS